MRLRRTYHPRPQFYLSADTKNRLSAAFLLLRRQGLVARQNFSCCSGCAGYELASQVGERVKKDPRQALKVKGCVFYHRQDGESLRESGRFMLSYGQLDTSECGRVGLPTEQVGRMVVEALEAFGVPYEWSGSGDERILVRLDLVGMPMEIVKVA